jgi:hypothetical protein
LHISIFNFCCRNSILRSSLWVGSCPTNFPLFMEIENSLHFHKNTPQAPILSQMNPVHTLINLYPRSIKISFHLRLGLASGIFPSGVCSWCFTGNFHLGFNKLCIYFKQYSTRAERKPGAWCKVNKYITILTVPWKRSADHSGLAV